MSRLSVRLFIALLTFTFGCAVSTVYRLAQDGTISPATIPTVEEPFEREPLACYPGRTVPIEFSNKSSLFYPRVLSPSRISWYSKHLTAMKEPAMYSEEGDGFESYRFLWLRSFHHPVVVRIWKSGGDHFILVKETNGAGGYEPRQLIIDRTRALTAAEWAEFIRLPVTGRFRPKMKTSKAMMERNGSLKVSKEVDITSLTAGVLTAGPTVKPACTHLSYPNLKSTHLLNLSTKVQVAFAE